MAGLRLRFPLAHEGGGPGVRRDESADLAPGREAGPEPADADEHEGRDETGGKREDVCALHGCARLGERAPTVKVAAFRAFVYHG